MFTSKLASSFYTLKIESSEASINLVRGSRITFYRLPIAKALTFAPLATFSSSLVLRILRKNTVSGDRSNLSSKIL